MSLFKARTSVHLLTISLLASTTLAMNLETVPVGNAGNAGELSGAGAGGYGPDAIVGGVAYNYNIGKYEVTNEQYTEFLNAVAKTDIYGLYSTAMWNITWGFKIQRSGTSGSYIYSVASDWANRPVSNVSWGDAARFANWMHNGQPTGAQSASTTEDGTYDLSATQQYYGPEGMAPEWGSANWLALNAALATVSRKANATWAIPSEDEWYKAAYHKNDGVTGNYFDYPTSSNDMPSNVLGNPDDPGNNATYRNNGDTIGRPYYFTEFGAHENSDSPYGTFDQGGNVWEWNESVPFNDLRRGVRGGSFEHDIHYLHASYRNFNYGYSTYEINFVGFRVAYVPEPATLTLLAVGVLFVARRKKQ